LPSTSPSTFHHALLAVQRPREERALLFEREDRLLNVHGEDPFAGDVGGLRRRFFGVLDGRFLGKSRDAEADEKGNDS